MGSKDQIISTQKQNKTFDYTKGDGAGLVNLNFTLRVDMKTQLRNFAELLKAGLTDVEEELKRFQ